MAYSNSLRCERCRQMVFVPAYETSTYPGPVTCSDCQSFLRQHPDVAEAEFHMAITRSQQDSIEMRARWAAQDAAKGVR
jgi:hypothetical protein